MNVSEGVAIGGDKFSPMTSFKFYSYFFCLLSQLLSPHLCFSQSEESFSDVYFVLCLTASAHTTRYQEYIRRGKRVSYYVLARLNALWRVLRSMCVYVKNYR